MNLLPKCYEEFGSHKYWEKFFKKRGEKVFEWYGEYLQLCGILHKFLKTDNKVLVIGCGNSDLSANLYDVGVHNIVNIDISATVINQMIKKHIKRPEMTFITMDMTKTSFSDDEFNVILDKGTLDAVMPNTESSTIAIVDTMFDEINRVTKTYGRYICISLAQPHILNKLLEYFPNHGWVTKIHVAPESNDGESREFHMPLFVFVFTKFPKEMTLPKRFEFYNGETCIKYDTVDEVMNALTAMQNYGMLRNQIQHDTSHLEEQPSVAVYQPGNEDAPRYVVYVSDYQTALPKKCAVFVVPLGRENDWLYSTKAGRLDLCKLTETQRLLVIHLSHQHTYIDLEQVKAELNHTALDLMTESAAKNPSQVQFLTLDNCLSHCEVVYQGTSELSGPYSVLDVKTGTNLTLRRLVFHKNMSLSQTECRLIPKSSKKKKKLNSNQMVVDPNYLTCQYSITIVAGLLSYLTSHKEGKANIALIGLGGGMLPRFIQNQFTRIFLEVIELDPEVVIIAKKYFGFDVNEHTQVIVMDGLEYIQELNKKGVHKNVIIIDVDNKDSLVGMSCPPQAFVTTEFLHSVKSCLTEDGLLMINVACRDTEMLAAVIATIRTVYPKVYTASMTDDLNVVVFASLAQPLLLPTDARLQEQLMSLQMTVNKSTGVNSSRAHISGKGAIVNIVAALDNLKLL